MYDGGWKDKAADGYGVMKWQNGDRLEIEAIPKEHGLGKMGTDWDELKSHPHLTLQHTIGWPRYEGDWVAGLREGKGKYLSKPTGEMSYIEMATTIER